MRWYDELLRYFPRAEMRVREHFEWLIANRPDIYRVQATPEYVLLYLAYDDLNFIDYLYVYPHARTGGVGTRAMQALQAQGKAILLEVEPPSPADPDSARRRRFYDRLGFWQVESIGFRLPSPLTGGEGTALDLLLWAPAPVPEETVFHWMERMYGDLYAAIDPAIYGKPYPPVGQCLTWTERR